MAGLSTVTVDLERAEVVLAGRRIALTAAPDATDSSAAGMPPSRFRVVDDSDGTTAIVRLLTFGERSRLVRLALADAVPARSLLDSVRRVAFEGSERLLFDAVLLAMNGGAEQASDFDGCAVDASRLRAWSWQQLQETPAIVVDRSVPRAETQDTAGSWQRFVFPGANPQAIEALLDSMVATLLARGEASVGSAEAPGYADTESPRAARALTRVDRSSGDVPNVASDKAVTDGASVAARPIRWRTLTSTPTVPNAAPETSASGRLPGPPTPAPGPHPAHSARSAERVPASRAPGPAHVRGAALTAAVTGAPTSGRHTDQAAGAPSSRPLVSPPATARALNSSRPAASVAYAAGSRRQTTVETLDSRSELLLPRSWPSNVSVPTPATQRPAHERAARPDREWAAPATPAALATMPAPRTAASADVVDQVARALAAECDLRGLDV